jgi:hypothetical protein
MENEEGDQIAENYENQIEILKLGIKTISNEIKILSEEIKAQKKEKEKIGEKKQNK